MVGIGSGRQWTSSLPAFQVGRPPGPTNAEAVFSNPKGWLAPFFPGAPRGLAARGLATRDSQNYGHNSPRLLLLASSTY